MHLPFAIGAVGITERDIGLGLEDFFPSDNPTGRWATFRTQELAEEWSPFATFLFSKPFVKGVYVCNNFVTVTKELNYP